MQSPEVCVVYVLRSDSHGADEVLLGRKRRGLGEAKVVAPGGKVEPGESVRDAAVRELAEEVGLTARAQDLDFRGVLDYVFPFRPAWSQRSSVFVCREWVGSVTGSAELMADWISVADVPYERMWSDARWWLPDVLGAGASVSARFEFAADLESVADSDDQRWRRAQP